MNKEKWLLPEGIEEFLPQEAKCLESLRRRLLSLFSCWGYDLVVPPIVEYIDSLLTGSGSDLELKTFKFIDQASGRTLGIRSDITPQVARIDSHQLSHDHPNRLCFIGTVLHTTSSDFLKSRNIEQIGAELYGHAGDDSDKEIIGLMLASVELIGVSKVHLDLGHVGIFRGLVKAAALSSEDERALFDALQRKSKPDIENILTSLALNEPHLNNLRALADLHGDREILQQARDLLAGSSNSVLQAIDSLETIASFVASQWPEVTLHFDLGELRGYNYHTGLVFTAYTPDHIQAIAQGGRYDDIGKTFGRARPATGFSADLRTFIKLDSNKQVARRAIFAPVSTDEQQLEMIKSLRLSGERVICELAGQADSAQAQDCDRVLEKSQKGDWQVVKLLN